MINVNRAANEAVFQLQFNSRDAIRYIQRNSGVDAPTAERAFKATVLFHREPKANSWKHVSV